MHLEAENEFDESITKSHAKQMVNEGQSEMENVKLKPKLVNYLMQISFYLSNDILCVLYAISISFYYAFTLFT